MTLKPPFREVPLRSAPLGSIGLFWGRSLVSRVIRWGERLAGEGGRPPSHAFIIYNRDLILEAMWPRITLRRITRYRQARVQVFDVPVHEKVKAAALRELIHTRLGHRYGLTTVAAFAVIEPLRSLGILLPNWLDRKDQEFCSELATIYLKMIGSGAALEAPAETDPANLYNWIRGERP